MFHATAPSRRLRLHAGALLAAGLLVVALPGIASAKGKPSPPPAPSGNGRCWVTPAPVPVGTLYTVNGSGFAPNEVLQEWVTGYNTTIIFAGADANGNISGAQAWAVHSGSYQVTVKDGNGTGSLATCAFTVS